MNDLPPNLLRDEGDEFSDADLSSIEDILRRLSNARRIEYRDTNALAIANHPAPRMLVVAGPGAGKSYMFMDRVRAWLQDDATATVRVASFVRKLVHDLQSDVDSLDPSESARVVVSTLHRLARSYVEQNGGCASLRLEPHVRMISREWEECIWLDALAISNLDPLPINDMKALFHNNSAPEGPEWIAALESFSRIRQFYNAIGFADSITLAMEAVSESPDLIDASHWIFDEFQDFNRAEEQLILALTQGASGLLLAGDDDQAIYQNLKQSHPEIIRSYYIDKSFAKGLLPYCSRCSHHIALAAEAFFKKHQLPESIKKVFLPLQEAGDEDLVQVVGCAHPSTAVLQVEKFIEVHEDELKKRSEDLESGKAKDPFLLVLTFANDLGFLGSSAELRLLSAAEKWQLAERRIGSDFLRLLTYRQCARYAKDNFALRKVLAYESVPDDDVRHVISDAIQAGVSLSEQGPELTQSALEVCAKVRQIMESPDLTPEEKADSISDVVTVEDPEQLIADIAAHISPEGDVVMDEDDEEIRTLTQVSPVELMTMSGAKGLSADHVFILGCDPINMGKAPAQVFFVALTRARRSLTLIVALRAKGAAGPHPYLADLSPVNCRYIAAKQNGNDEKNSFEQLAGWLEYIHNMIAKS